MIELVILFGGSEGEVLIALEWAGLTLNLFKCIFGILKAEYVGFVLSAKGVRPGPEKVNAIAKFPIPKNAHDLRRFLGLTSFFRRFIPGYSKIAFPLTELTKKDASLL